jgi:hypothetical protein
VVAPVPTPSAVANPAPVPRHANELDIDLGNLGGDSPPGDRGIVDESVAEMLAQSSEQTLQLVRMEDALSHLTETLDDLREEMHAGFAEIRALVSSAGAVSNAPDPMLSARLDAIEESASRGARNIGGKLPLLIALQALAAVLAAVAVWAALQAGSAPSVSAPSPLPPAEVSGMPQPEAPRSYGEEVADEDERLRGKKKAPRKKGKTASPR